ncbi:hypothetical protein [Dactylosporangium sp. NPDC005555]|uniref:hypothetical protein n=1 Tax=Dactylosporangium sp. NPDC005555 TaxID=3154889 RepID=UPI0033ACC74B
MDALERLSGIGIEVLHRADAVLVAGGAPVGDPIWALSRAVGALPGDALEFGLKLDPAPLRVAATQLRGDADRFARRREWLAADLSGVWEGSGAEAFAARWGALSAYIGGGGEPESITGRLRATAAYADALADWSEGLRGELAEAVARVATSAEAVTMRGEPVGEGLPSAAVIEAAARIGVRVLQPVADAFGVAQDLLARWSPELVELRYTEPTTGATGAGTPTTRVAL